MLVLMVLEHDYPPDIRVEKEIKTLLKEGHQIVLACTKKKGEDEVEHTGNLTVFRKYMPKFIYQSSVGCLKFPFYFNFWRSFLKYVLINYNVDLIHLHDLPLAKVVYEIKSDKKIPLVIDSHENYPYMLESSLHTKTTVGKLLHSTNQWLHYEKEMLKKADVIISIIEEQRQRFESMGIRREKIFIVSNTPERVSVQSLDIKKVGFTYVYAGNIYLSKGIDVMIKAFRLLTTKIPNVVLWIVGDYERLDNYLLDKKIDKGSIKFWGWKPLEDLYRIVASADVALLPHLKNKNSDYGIPNKLFQYMMIGKPIIATNCRPIKRIIQETQAGVLYDPNNFEDLTDKMHFLFRNQQQAKIMGKKGKQAVSTKYNWEIEEKNLLAAYNTVRNIDHNR